MEWITVLAILVSPLLAVQVTQWLNTIKEQKARRIDIFARLMATRATRTSPAHVEALNRIDTEFYSRKGKFKPVINAWRIYHDHLNDPKMRGNTDDSEWKLWTEKGSDLYTALLYEMSRALGYDFDEVAIKRGHYYPQGLGQIEDELTIVRKGLVDIFTGKKLFPILAFLPPQQTTGETESDKR